MLKRYSQVVKIVFTICCNENCTGIEVKQSPCFPIGKLKVLKKNYEMGFKFMIRVKTLCGVNIKATGRGWRSSKMLPFLSCCIIYDVGYRYSFVALSSSVSGKFQKSATRPGNTEMSARWKFWGNSVPRSDMFLRRSRKWKDGEGYQHQYFIWRTEMWWFRYRSKHESIVANEKNFKISVSVKFFIVPL